MGQPPISAFDYLSVLFSIVLGLSITQLLAGFASMVRGRARVAFYWPLPLQMLALFLINVQSWWRCSGCVGCASGISSASSWC